MPPLPDQKTALWQKRDQILANLERRVQVMGILNLTPDSFSDGGRFNVLPAALDQALAMQSGGADLLDIGAESTRPGSQAVSAEEEWRRLEPVLTVLKARLSVPLSIDTYKAEIAHKALSLGAVSFVNDVGGLQQDPDMASVVARHGAGVVIMHNRACVDTSLDILQDIRHFFRRSLQIARQAGIDERHIILDPGIGFGKSFDQNLTILANLHELRSFARPLLMGLSRKGFLGQILGAPVDARLTGTVVANIWSMMNGVSLVRVHDVAEHVAAVNVWQQKQPSIEPRFIGQRP